MQHTNLYQGIKENSENRYRYGWVRYFKGNRLFPSKQLYEFNQGKIRAKEWVTFDAALMDLNEISKEELEKARIDVQQIMAVIIRPDIVPNRMVEHAGFAFCGYDLVEHATGVSAITNCGADWGNAINYETLNEYGLISDYREAVTTQLDLAEQFPDENHAYCEIVEMWRMLG